MSETTELPKPTAFVDPASRRRAVKLAFPIIFDGSEHHEVFIRRPTVGEIGAWADSKGETALDLYVDASGKPIPDAVFQGLDPDDNEEVSRVAKDFLPRRLSEILFAPPAPSAPTNASDLADGAATAPMSEKPLDGPSPS